jgi:predicted dehydrogenase
MKLRVALVGLGSAWESRHRPALRALSDRFEIRAICEPVAHRAEMAAREFGATPVDGFRAVLDREDVDAIMVLSNQWFGALPIFAACDAGKAVYCAAPLDFDPEVCRSLKQRIENSGVAFVAEFSRRQSPATIRLKELIATQLGKPQMLFCHQRVPTDSRPESRPTGKSVLRMHDMVELVDWCRYVAGREPTSVVGISHINPSTVEKDYEMMSLDFSGCESPGTVCTAQISSGRYIPSIWNEAVAYRPPAALQVACENGIAFIDLPATLIWFDRAGRHMESLEGERPVGEQLLASFFRSVTSLVRTTSGLNDAFRAIEVVQAARKSALEGHREAIPAS